MKNTPRYRFTILLYVCFIFTFFSCQIKHDEPTENKLEPYQQLMVNELNQWAVRLEYLPLLLPDSDLTFLNPLKDARIVGLGEATHGTKEFFQMKHRVFRYLVEHFGHKVFGFEADFGESIYLNKYVTRGEGDLEDLMKNKMHFWTWRTEEVKQLLEWMKEYNENKREKGQIHFIGFDCQYYTFQADLVHEYLQGVLPTLWDDLAPGFDRVWDLNYKDFENMSVKTFESIKAQFDTMQEQYASNKAQLVQNSSTRDYEIHKQLIRNFQQAFILTYYYYQDEWDFNWRDLFMAENARWAADLFGPDTKISLWAHNGHVARTGGYNNSGSMGYHLDKELGNLYQVVGFGFSLGSFQARGVDENGQTTDLRIHTINTEPPSHTYNILFHYSGHDNFAFHLGSIPQDSYWYMYHQNGLKLGFLSIGALFNGNPEQYYGYINICDKYDWILYFDKTGTAKALEQL